MVLSFSEFCSVSLSTSNFCSESLQNSQGQGGRVVSTEHRAQAQVGPEDSRAESDPSCGVAGPQALATSVRVDLSPWSGQTPLSYFRTFNGSHCLES